MFRESVLRDHRSLTVAALLAGALRAHGAWGVAFPPKDLTAPKPAVVYLHGMWASPEDSCGAFEHAATPFGFLVCPRGNAPLGDGKMWSGTYASVAPNIHAALDAAAAPVPGKLDRSGGGTLVGFSNGAYFAAEVAQSEPGKWTGLVLLSMRLDLDVARLRAAGVRRVVLGAGDKDGVRDSMKALATRTDAAGLPARFVSLGPVGHEFPPDMDARMCDAIAWVREADPAACRPP
jgi:predicted esterase